MSKTKVSAYEHLFRENTTLLKGQIYVWQLSCNCLYTASLRIQLERRQENKKIQKFSSHCTMAQYLNKPLFIKKISFLIFERSARYAYETSVRNFMSICPYFIMFLLHTFKIQYFNFHKDFGLRTVQIISVKYRNVFVTTCSHLKESKHHQRPQQPLECQWSAS